MALGRRPARIAPSSGLMPGQTPHSQASRKAASLGLQLQTIRAVLCHSLKVVYGLQRAAVQMSRVGLRVGIHGVVGQAAQNRITAALGPQQRVQRMAILNLQPTIRFSVM